MNYGYGLPYGEAKANYTLWPMGPMTEAEIVEMLDNSIASHEEGLQSMLTDPTVTVAPEGELRAQVNIAIKKAQKDLFQQDPSAYLGSRPAIPDLTSEEGRAAQRATMTMDLVELDHALVQGYTSPEAYVSTLSEQLAFMNMMAAATPAQLKVGPQAAEAAKAMFGQAMAEMQTRIQNVQMQSQPAPSAQAAPPAAQPVSFAPAPATTLSRPLPTPEFDWKTVGMQAAVGALAGKVLFDNPLVGAVSAPLILHFVGKIPKGG